MSAAEAQEVKNFLLQSDQQFRQLAEQHHQLDDRLHQLIDKHYLSETEQIEEVILKKKKLALKDQMESIERQFRMVVQQGQVRGRVEERGQLRLAPSAAVEHGPHPAQEAVRRDRLLEKGRAGRGGAAVEEVVNRIR